MSVKSFVVGGAGFIGSHLVDRLLADGDAVDVVDDLSRGSLANLADARSAGGSLKIHHLDAGTAEAASLLGMRQPDVVYHLAAIPRRAAVRPRWPAGAHHDDGAARRRARRIASPRSSSRCRRPRCTDTRRAATCRSRSSRSSRAGLRGVIARATVDLLATYRETDAVEFTALALSTVYGPRQRADGGVVAALASRPRAGRPPTITGDGRQTRDLLFVDDAVDALVRAGTRGSGLVVNIGTGEQTSVRDLWAAASPGGWRRADQGAGAPDELPRFAVSPVRARIHLGWSPWTSVADGLRQIRR